MNDLKYLWYTVLLPYIIMRETTPIMNPGATTPGGLLLQKLEDLRQPDYSSTSVYIPPNPFMPGGGWVDIPSEPIPPGQSSGPFSPSSPAGGSNYDPTNPDNPTGSSSGCGGIAAAGSYAGSMTGISGDYQNAGKLVSPIVLDLDGDGIETTALANGVYFDLTANSFAEQTGWIKSDDGILALDRNGNGVIDDGRELFGDYSVLENGKTAPNGFSSLAELDDNQDGKIDVNDAAYSQLKIWPDISQDGISNQGELFSLADLGVKSLTTSYQNVDITDAQDNVKKQQSVFERLDGTLQEISDYYFKTNQMWTLPSESIEVPANILPLPNIAGTGTVYSLHQAMARDTSGELQSLVESFIAETDPTNRTAIVEQLLLKWTGSESIDPASMGLYVNAQQLNVVESFMGEEYQGIHGYMVFGPDAGSALSISYQDIRELVYSQLMLKTNFQGLSNMIVYKWYEERQSLEGNLSNVRTELENRFQADHDQGKTDIAEFFRTLRGSNLAGMMQDYWYTRNNLASLDPDLGWQIDSAGKNMISSSSGDDTITGTSVGDAIAGGDGNDIILANNNNSFNDDDVLYGNGGNDTLNGFSGDDILDGGAGNDILQGGQGDDVYLYGIGSGNDTIISYESGYSNGFDTVQLVGNMASDSVDVLQNGEDLIIKIKSTGETITADRWFMGEDRQYDQIRFTDNHKLTANELSDRAIVQGTDGDNILNGSLYHGDKIYGLAGNDVLYGFGGGTDQLFGGEGNDKLFGGDGNDLLNGDAGNDEIYGSAGNDIIDGGAGDDLLTGGQGDDAYLYGVGSGNDTIHNTENPYSNGFDTVQLVGDLTADSVDILQNGEDLILKIKSTGETITADKWFMGENYQYDQVHFTDNQILTAAELTSLAIVRGSDSDDTLLFGSAYHGDKIYGLARNDSLYGNDGNDQLFGGDGNDNLNGGNGDDILDGGAGNDSLTGGTGNDTYIFGIGSGNGKIDNTDSGWATSVDIIQMGDGITADSIEFTLGNDMIYKNDLAIKIKSSGETLKVYNWFANDSYQVDKIRFADGTELTAAAMTNLTVLQGNDNAESLFGSDKDDKIYGMGGNDTIRGGLGNDLLDGGAGNDTLYGQAGNDTYIVDNIGDIVIENMNEGTDTVKAIITYTLGVNVENLVLTGTANINGTGNTLNNVIIGNNSNNVLFGGAGDDYLDGGAGNDTLTGGAGSDTYFFGNGSGYDLIAAFDGNSSDKVEFGNLGTTDLSMILDGSNLIISTTTGDHLTLENWGAGGSNSLNSFHMNGSWYTTTDAKTWKSA